MFRWSLLLLLSAVSLAAQIRWKCGVKDGRFTDRPCAGCALYYCWDGQVFSTAPGYTPPPANVLAYWEEKHRESEQIRAGLAGRTKGPSEESQPASPHLIQEPAPPPRQPELQARVRGRQPARSQPPAAQAKKAPPANPPAGPPPVPEKTKLQTVPALDSSAPRTDPCSRAKVSEVQLGMRRSEVEGILGKAHSAVSIPGDDGLVETLTYTLEEHGTAHVRIVEGNVVSVKISE